MTPEALARMLVATYGLENRSQIANAILSEYPRADVDALIDEAAQELAESEAEADRLIAEEEARARDAEHDLSKSMHLQGGRP